MHFMKNVAWILKHPLLACHYHKLKGCREGDFVYHDFSYSSEYDVSRIPIGFVGYINHQRDNYAGNRIYIVGIDTYNQKLCLNDAIKDCEAYDVIGTNRHNWTLGNWKQLVSLSENSDKLAQCLQNFTKQDVLENMFWTTSEDRKMRSYYAAVRLKDGFIYQYNERYKTYFLRLLIL